MNRKNIGVIAVTAIIILVCLLFSWTSYDDDSQVRWDEAEDEWSLIYTYSTGGERPNYPAEVVLMSSGKTLTLTSDTISGEVIRITGTDAQISGQDNGLQLYFDGNYLYIIHKSESGEILTYGAYSRGTSAEFPGILGADEDP